MLTLSPTIKFTAIVDSVLEAFMLRETNVKDVCCELAAKGIIKNTWGTGNKKPSDETMIQKA